MCELPINWWGSHPTDLLYVKMIEFYLKFGEWGIWFSRLIKLSLFAIHLTYLLGKSRTRKLKLMCILYKDTNICY